MQPNNKYANRQHEIFRLQRDEFSYEVGVDSDITLDDYWRITHEHEWKLLQGFADAMAGKRVVFINPTMTGGGVAMLRPPLVHVLRLFGVKAHWFVMESGAHPEESNPFLFTKQMHNILQRRTLPHERITDRGKAIHQEWCEANATVLMEQPAIREADVIVLDDPQTAPLKAYLEQVNPDAAFVWRNHIDTDGGLMADPDTPQGEVAKYLFDDCGIGGVEAIISHPVERFVHPDYRGKTYFAPATIEPFDDLNRVLTQDEIQQGLEFVNAEIRAQNHHFQQAGRTADIQPYVEPQRRRITLLARFDESKGMDKALELGARVRELLAEQGVGEEELPQVILAGNGSVDDPSGIPMYEEMLQLRREHYPDAAHDTIIIRLPHNYMAVNALMYPHSRGGSYDGAQLIGLQMSEAEGMETRISDWIRHGVPVVVSNRGGMGLQVIESKSGFVLDYERPDYDIEYGAECVSRLMLDDNEYARMRETAFRAAEEYNDREFTTVANAIRLLRVFGRVLKDKPADKKWNVKDMTIQESSKQLARNSINTKSGL